MPVELAFAAGMLLTAISGRTTTLAVRGRVSRPLDIINAVRDLVGLIAGLCFWALTIWGFASLVWYVALPIVLVSGLVGGTAVNNRSFALFHRIEPLVDIASVAATFWLWFVYWPF